MKTTALMLSAWMAALLLLSSSTDAKHLKHHSKSHKAHHKIHLKTSSRHHKFQETRLVADYDNCNNRDGHLVLCATLGFECQLDPEQPQIDNQPPNDPICMPAQDNGSAQTGLDPWSSCKDGDTCGYNFQCICDDYANQKCWCRPPDAVRMERDTSEGNPPCGAQGCFDDQYCKYARYTPDSKDLIKVCAAKPYYTAEEQDDSVESSDDQ